MPVFRRTRFGIVVVAVLLFVTMWGSVTLSRAASTAPADSLDARPQVESRPERGARTRFTFGVGVGRGSDDNVLQLTQNRLDRMITSPGPPRFLIQSPGDALSALSLDAGLRARVLPRRITRLDAGLDLARFDRDDVLDREQYAISLQQEVTARRRALTSIKLSWDHLPRYYLGEITDPDESFAAGIRVRRSLTYAQNTLGASLDQRLFRGSLDLTAGFERVHRDYNAHFDERDNDNDLGWFTAEVQPFRRWAVTLGVTGRWGTLDARGELPETPIRDTDISYDHHGVGASLGIPWGKGASRGRVELEWMPEIRRYTTSDKFDLTRFERTNHRKRMSARVTQQVWGALDLVATIDRLVSDASFPSGVAFDPDATDFTQTRSAVMLRGRWDIPRR
jgi:hypothetical protein